MSFDLAVCSEMVYTELPHLERVERIRAAGFAAEIWDWTGKDADALVATGARFTSMTGYVSGDLTTGEHGDPGATGVDDRAATHRGAGARWRADGIRPGALSCPGTGPGTVGGQLDGEVDPEHRGDAGPPARRGGTTSPARSWRCCCGSW